MIEVEKKFLLGDEDTARLLLDARFLGERVFTDIYYDTKELTLSLLDKWLRAREGKFELKLPLHSGMNRLADQYDELEDEESIKNALGFPREGVIKDILPALQYTPFCTCKTTRRKYQKGEFIIDLDLAEFPDFSYRIGEIELMVSEKLDIAEATEKILVFAREQKLAIAPVRGKVTEYLRRKKPDHYRALVEAKIIQG